MNLKKVFKTILVISLMFFINGESFGQFSELFSKKNKRNQYSSFGIGGGSTHYFGDLAPYRYFYYSLYTNVRWNATLNYTKFFDAQNGFRASYSLARLYGNDETFAKRNLNKLASNYIRNLNFRNDVNEFTISYIRNLLPSFGEGFLGRNKFMPYATIGLGLITNNPKGYVNNVIFGTNKAYTGWMPLRTLSTSGQGLPGNALKGQYSGIQMVLPLTLGMKMRIGNNLDLAVEGGLRISNSDYLDDVGNTGYASLADLKSNFGLESATLSYRAAENIEPIGGADRTALYQQAAIILGKTVTAGTTPSNSAANNVYPIASSSTKRGSSRPDSYILTQVTLSYVMGNKLKCPAIK